MTGTNHGMTGAVIALLVKEPVAAIPLSFLSHFACDTIPHFGVRDLPGQADDELFTKKFNTILIVDFLVAVTLMIVIGHMFPAQRWVVWACMVAAASPDLMWIYYRIYIERVKKQKPQYGWVARFHMKIQWSQTYPGAFVEIVWFVLMGYIILSRR